MAIGSLPAALKTYWIPLLFFLASLFFQLIVLPRSSPPSRYAVLGLEGHSSVDQVKDAYENLSSKWISGVEIPSSSCFIEIRYAYELLTHPLWKRNYDIFGIDEQIHVVDMLKRQYAGKSYMEIEVPLLEATSSDIEDDTFNAITFEEFKDMLGNLKASLIQLYSLGSKACAAFSEKWKTIAILLDGVANTGAVELGEVQLAAYLAQKRPTGQPFFSNGIPSLVAFPLDCRASHCIVRYDGELSVNAVTDWFSTAILNLPRILYYTKESLGQNFLAKSRPYKVKVILFSRTGERATPFVRQAVKNYWAYASFAFVLWREEESIFWSNMFNLESAPAIVILKDPGVKPIVYHGSVNSSWLINILESNKHQELPALRSVTSMELGCDARGYSRAGSGSEIWYCVILAGRLSPELDKLRKTMRRVQEILSTYVEALNNTEKDQMLELSAFALKQKRLTFAWLDGEMQKDYCIFYLDMPHSHDACGPRRYPIDVPQLFIVRYKRNASEDDLEVQRKSTALAGFQKNFDRASQLVAKYNGTEETQEIIRWISKIINDGDNSNLPFYRTKTPDLIPEEADPLRSKGAQTFFATGKDINQRIQSAMSGIYLAFGPVLLLGALLSFSGIWLRSKLPVHSSQSSRPVAKDEDRRRQRSWNRTTTSESQPPSITDEEPKNAYQILLSDSDSD